MGEHRSEAQNRPHRHPQLQQLARQPFAVVPAQDGLEGAAQLIAVGEPGGVGGKARILRQFGMTEVVHQQAELAVGAAGDEDLAGGGGELVVEADVGMGVAQKPGLGAVQEPVGGMRVEQGDGHIPQAGFHILAAPGTLALQQRHEDGDGGGEPGGEIDDGDADAHGAAVLIPIDAHGPRHRLGDGVIARKPAERAVIAEAGDAAVDQPREAFRQHLVIVQPPAPHGAGLEVLDHHIGAGQKPQQHLAPFGASQVEAEIALVAVDADEIGGGTVGGKGRAPAAGLVTTRRLHLDHLRPVVGEPLGTVGTAQHAGEVHHPHPFERALRLPHRHLPRRIRPPHVGRNHPHSS